MSGGSMNYLCYRVAEAEFSTHTIERQAFKKHLQKIASAMKEIEWVDSGDTSPGNENAAIRDCLTQTAILEAAIELAVSSKETLEQQIDIAKRLINEQNT